MAAARLTTAAWTAALGTAELSTPSCGRDAATAAAAAAINDIRLATCRSVSMVYWPEP